MVFVAEIYVLSLQKKIKTWGDKSAPPLVHGGLIICSYCVLRNGNSVYTPKKRGGDGNEDTRGQPFILNHFVVASTDEIDMIDWKRYLIGKWDLLVRNSYHIWIYKLYIPLNNSLNHTQNHQRI